jgi:glucose-fructose oxidoreductase
MSGLDGGCRPAVGNDQLSLDVRYRSCYGEGDIEEVWMVRQIRYAVVGLGHIAQIAVLPAFAHARRNSVLTALVSGDATKRRELSRRYRIDDTFAYAKYDRCLERVDAVYIALPNAQHAEYTVRAVRAGVHVLCEKPMATTVVQCRQMIRACRSNGVKLMIAYRLHFDAMNLGVMDLVRRGAIGEPRYFNSSFSEMVRAGNIRTQASLGGGTLYDIGIYCINAARYLFRAEPRDVQAVSSDHTSARLKDVDETTAAVLRFDKGRLASFTCSFNAADVSSYRIVGSKGDIRVDPAYGYAQPMTYTMTRNGRTRTRTLGKRDQFAPELLYFSDCILKDRQPEPSGEEGLQDVRIIEALYQSARRGRRVAIPPFADRYPEARQRITRPGIRKPQLVKAKSGSD